MFEIAADLSGMRVARTTSGAPEVACNADARVDDDVRE
jgi:hypothetical protein